MHLSSFLALTALLAAPLVVAQTPPPSGDGPDACTLFPREEIARLQETEITDVKSITETKNGLHIAQCLYVAKDPKKSVTLRVVRSAGEKGRSVREVWRETFSPAAFQMIQEQKTKRRPESVKNVGEEAFWMGDHKAGALYVPPPVSMSVSAPQRCQHGGTDRREHQPGPCRPEASLQAINKTG